jgi:formyl-CoA transferase
VTATDEGPRALGDLRVLELGSLVAGPFAGHLLAGFGADVIKVEPPGRGDELRRWRKLEGDTSLWWRSLARGKRCVTCDLRQPEGRALVRRLLATGRIDVVIENFRPGRMEAWGLGWEELHRIDRRIVMVRISGYGQTGPYRDRPGFANVAEAFGGLRYVTGDPDRPPLRTGVSLGDSLAGLHAAFGALAAIHARDAGGLGVGQVVDVALYEAVMSVMESLVPEYDRLGHVRERTGSRLPGIVPSGTYACADGRFVVIGANSDALFHKLAVAMERPDLASDPRFRSAEDRSAHAAEIDAAIEAFTLARDHDGVVDTLVRAGVPAGPIQSVADLVADPHVRARGMIERINLPDGSPLAVSRIVPMLSATPAQSGEAGPDLGAHNAEVWGELVGLSAAELSGLAGRGVI